MSNLRENRAAAGEIGATWRVSLLILTSRLLGFARLVLFIHLFAGYRWVSDAFIFAFRIPNLFRNLLGEGALSASFIPVFMRTRLKSGDESAAGLGSAVLSALGLVGGALAALGAGLALALESLAGDDAKTALALRLIALLFPFMPLVCLAAILGGMLQSLRRFALPAAASIIINLGFLAGFAQVYWGQCGGNLENLDPGRATGSIALFVLGAGLVEALVQWLALARAGIRLAPSLSFAHPGLRETATAFFPAALGLGLVQVNAFFDSLIAGWLSLSDPGAVTYLEIGVRFMQLPLGVFGAAIAAVYFPALTASAALGEKELFFERLIRAARMSMFLILPSSALLVAMADPVIRLAYQRPDLAFDHAAVYRASLALILYSGGLIFYSFRQILVRAFYALGDYSFPVKTSAAMVILNLALNLILIHCPDPHRLWNPSYFLGWNLAPGSFPGGNRLGEAGLALSTLLTAAVDCAVLGLGLRKRLFPGLSAKFRSGELARLLHTALRLAATSLALGIMTWLYRNSIPYDPGFILLLERVAVPGLLALGTFYLIGIILPLPEMEEFIPWLRKRNGRH
ncbi:MAG: murein biosynthesis integral membrane protein MurJ [Planctomycetota bacterium]|nr:murein biosynthesis integral membrane protein MurJ [Planctomycetota bacterium]